MRVSRTSSLCTVVASLLLAASLPVLGAPDKMDRRQAEAVSRANSYTLGIAEELESVEKGQAELETSGPSTVSKQGLIEFKEKLKRLRNQLSNAERAVQHVADGPDEVKAAKATIAEQQAVLAAATEAAAAFEKKQDAVRNVGNYPNFKADCDKLQKLTKVYAPFDLLRDPKRAGDLAARWSEDVKEAQAMFAVYKPLAEQQTFEGKNFLAHYTNLAKNIKEFQAKAQEALNAAPGAIDASLGKALAVATKAAAEKKPAFFEGGVKQEVDAAKAQLALFSAIAGEKHEKTLEIAAGVAEQEKKIAVLKDSLKEQILAETRTPADAYAKGDKGALKEKVLAAWKGKFPGDQVLAVRFVQPEWKRKTGHSWNAGDKAWEFYDYSDLTARIVIKKDDRLATLCYVTLRKDHQSNDQTTATPHKGDLYVVEDMLLANVEP